MRYTTGQVSEWSGVTIPVRWTQESIARLGRSRAKNGHDCFTEAEAQDIQRCNEAKLINPK